MSRALTVLLAAVLLVAGCTTGEDGADGGGADGGGMGGGVEAADDVVTPFDRDVDPMRVLLAVIVLTTGSVDAAVAEGLVTPEELDIAESAIADREVSAWLARADLTLNGG
jgi:hypothetical protein